MLRPIAHLNAIAKRYPDAWKQVETLRRDRGNDLPDWPEWCFMPMAAWYSIISAHHRTDRLPLEFITDVANLATLGSWRYSQGVYRFDPDTFSALSDTIVKGERTGAQLRQANETDPSGRAVKPHLRRAHWHSYWRGPKTGERQFRYKWLSPIIVGGNDNNDDENRIQQ